MLGFAATEGTAWDRLLPKGRKKGQKPYESDKLLPLQGEDWMSAIPKAMPWAMCLLAFQAVFRIDMDNHYNNYA